MKAYEIIDKEGNKSIGVLQYFEKDESYVIELMSNLDEWTAPLLLTKYVKNKIFTIPREVSFMWVKGRVIPSNRQNISDILTSNGLKKYDEMKLLELTSGCCAQDSMYIRRITDLPDYVVKRVSKNLDDCVILDDFSLLCFFKNGAVKKVLLKRLTDVDGVARILENESLYRSGRLSAGGYAVTFNNSIDIPAGILYEAGITIPLSTDDFKKYVQKNVLDTSECCDLLSCTRQNLAYMVSQKQLTPIKVDVKGNLYLKGNVISKSVE